MYLRVQHSMRVNCHLAGFPEPIIYSWREIDLKRRARRVLQPLKSLITPSQVYRAAMSESMFGCPSQHLLPSQSSNNASEDTSQTVPVLPARPRFEDVHFETIGKQPDLLSRISLSDTATALFSSPSPSPASLSPLTSNVQPSSSRPTLFQKLAGGESMLASSASRTMTGQASNGSLTTRIQSNLSADPALSRPRIDRAKYMAVEGNDTSSSNLIPPIESLPSPESEGSSPPPGNETGVVSSRRARRGRGQHGPAAGTASPDPLHLSPSFPESRRPSGSQLESSARTCNMDQSHPTDPSVSSVSVRTIACTSSLPPAVTSALSLPQSMTECAGGDKESGRRELSQKSSMFNLESLDSHQARLQAISNNLTSLSSPSLSPTTSFSPPGLCITEAHDDLVRQEPSQQGDGDSVVLQHVYPAQHQSNLEVDYTSDSDNVDALAVTSTVTREFQTQTKIILEAVHNLSATFGVAHRAHIEAKNALVQQCRALDHQRALFAEHQRADEAAFQARSRELVQKEEELRVKEAAICALQRENRAKEDARRALIASRRAQEETKRAEEEARRQKVQQQITMALKELDELRTLHTEGWLGNGAQASEINVMEQRNRWLADVQRLRCIHEHRIQMLQESTNTLRRLQEERKKTAEERERCRLTEEEGRQAMAGGTEQVTYGAEAECAVEENTHRHVESAHDATGQDQLSTTDLAHGDNQALQQVSADRGGLELAQGRRQEDLSGKRPVAMTVENAAGARAARQGDVAHGTSNSTAGVDGPVMKHPTQPTPASDTQESAAVLPHGASSSSPAKKVVSAPISGGVMLSTSQQSGNINKPSGAKRPPSSGSASGSVNQGITAVKTSSFVSASTEVGRKVSTDTPLFPIQLASELQSVGNTNGNASESRRPHSPPTQKETFTPNPKFQTVLDAVASDSQELDLGPPTGVSPAQRSVNLRHLKKSRSRIEENGDRSVRRPSVKSEESAVVTLKMEESEGQPVSHDTEPATIEKREVSVSLSRRPLVIPPPRPRISMKPAAAVSRGIAQHELPFTGGEESSTRNAQPEPALLPQLPRASPSPWVMDASADHQEWALTSIDSESCPRTPQESASHPGAFAESAIQSSDEHDHQALASAPSSNRLAFPEYKSGELAPAEDEEHSRSRPRLSDETYKRRNRSSARRQTDHYSPSPTHASRLIAPSPPPSYRQSGDFWRPSSTSEMPRAQPMCAPSPITGRKRPFEINDDDHDHRHRRLKGSGWESCDREWEGRYRSRKPGSFGPYHPHDGQRIIYEKPPTLPTTSTLPPLRTFVRDQDSYRRPQEEVSLQRHEPFEAFCAPTGDQPSEYDHGEDREGVQHDPALLARMSDTQRHPPAVHIRNVGGRGRGVPGRGRGDPGRGRGELRSREVVSKLARVGNHLIGRISDGPAPLQDRLGEPTRSWRSPSS
ncbi:hypothetical protein F5I97DRAFT_763699 [Phlebopus sp. FC_14]|nr:hypothetical protein F5I97DRAFT_763699 [Phlebopus sp. FC_14]